MAARAPTGLTTYIDKSKVAPQEQIITTEVDACVEDQHFVMLRGQQVVGDSFRPKSVSSAGYVEIARYWLAFDRCGSTGSSTETLYWCVYGWTNVANNFRYQVRETVTANSGTLTIIAAHTTVQWRGFGQTTVNVDGTEMELILEAQFLAGSPVIYTAGFGAFFN